MPTFDHDVLKELAWSREGEKWEGNEDERFNGFTVHQSSLLSAWDRYYTDETIFSHYAYPGRFFRLYAAKEHSNGEHVVDVYVTEVFPHQVTVTEYRYAR